MNWDAIAALAQVIVAAVGIGSLVYLATQIRNNSKEIRAASFNTVTDSFNQFNFMLAQNAEVADLFLRGAAEYSVLNGVEEIRFDLMILGLFRVHESVFVQSNRGTMERDLRVAENRSLLWLVERPGIRAWWNDNPLSFTGEFREHIDALIKKFESAPR